MASPVPIQFLTTANGTPLTKTFANGHWTQFPPAYLYNHVKVEVTTTAELLEALQTIGDDGGAFIRGVINTEAQGIRRLLYPEGIYPATINDAPSAVWSADIDGLPVPLDLQSLLLDPEAMGRYAVSFLPEEFHSASFIIQLTSKHGFAPDVLRARLWCLLDQPATKVRCEQIVAPINAKLGTNCFDLAVFRPAQVQYIAPPRFADPKDDPCAGISRLTLISGDTDRVTLSPAPPCGAYIPRVPRDASACADLPSGTFADQLTALRSGAISAAGAHAQMLAVVGAGLRFIGEPTQVAAAVKAALTVGLPLSGLDESRVADLQRRMLDGNEVDSAADWYARHGEVEADTEGTARAVPLKDKWADDLRAAAQVPVAQRLATAKAAFYRYRGRAPKRCSVASFVDQLATAYQLATDERRELEAMAESAYAEKQEKVAVKLDVARTVAATRQRSTSLAKLREFYWNGQRQGDVLSGRLDTAPLELIMELNDETLRHITVDSMTAAQQAIAAAQGEMVIVVAPMGSGKTQVLIKNQLGQVETATVITHRRSLVSDVCAKLGAADYRRGHDCVGARLLAVCQDSLEDHSFHVQRSDLVVIDEWTQCLAAQVLPSQMKEPWLIQKATLAALRSAPQVLLTDADLSAEALCFLARANRPMVVIEVKVPEPPLQVRILSEVTNSKTVLIQVNRWLDAGETVLVAADSRDLVAEIRELCLARGLAESEFACINSDSAGDYQALLANVNAGVAKLKVLAYSPTIGSGVSIEEPHFTKHLAAYFGAVKPTDMIQMARRDRTAEVLHLAFVGQVNQSGLETNFNSLLDRYRQAALAERRRCPASPGELSEFDIQRACFEAAENDLRNDGANNLVRLLAARGWAISYEGLAATDDELDDAAMLCQVKLKNERAAIVAAPALVGEAWDALEVRRQQGGIGLKDKPAIDHGVTRRYLKLDSPETLEGDEDAPPPVALTLADVELYDDGRIRPQIKKMEQTIASESVLKQMSLADGNRKLCDQIHPFARQAAYQALLGEPLVAALRGEEVAFTLTPAVASAAWATCAIDAQKLRGLGINVPKTQPKRLTGWFKNQLEGFGLEFGEGRRVGDGAERERVWDLDLNAMAAKIELAQRRLAAAEARKAPDSLGALAEERFFRNAPKHHAAFLASLGLEKA